MSATIIATGFPDEDDNRRHRSHKKRLGWRPRISHYLPRITSKKSQELMIEVYEELARKSLAQGSGEWAANWQACADALRKALNGSASAARHVPAQPAGHRRADQRRRPSVSRSRRLLPVSGYGILLVSIAVLFSVVIPTFAHDVPGPDVPSAVNPTAAEQRLLQAGPKSRTERALSRSVVEIRTPAARGTGVYAKIGEDYVILTAEHVLRDGEKSLAPFARFRGYNADPANPAEWQSIAAVASDGAMLRKIDLAIIVLEEPLAGFVPARLTSEEVKPGQAVVGFGFADRDGATLRGEVAGVDSNGGRFIGLRLPVMPGDSGGPVFDATTGLLIGIVSSQADPSMPAKYTCVPMAQRMLCSFPAEGQPMNATGLAVNLVPLMQWMSQQ